MTITGLLLIPLSALLLSASPTQFEILENRLKTALRSGDESGLLAVIVNREGIDALVQLCDDSPARVENSLEVAIANILQAARPRTPEEIIAVRRASLAVLRTTDDPQIALGLSYHLLNSSPDDSETLRKDALANAVHPELVSRTIADASILLRNISEETAPAAPVIKPAQPPSEPVARAPLSTVVIGSIAAIILYCLIGISSHIRLRLRGSPHFSWQR